MGEPARAEPISGEVDRVVHEPARLKILMLLSGVDEADFKFLLTTLGMTKGNLSSHMDRLEKSGYVKILKGFNGKVTHTRYQMTESGRLALTQYWRMLDEIRATTDMTEVSRSQP